LEQTKLTPKQRRFIDEYLTNGYNATAAAIAAGYAKKSAYIIGYENLRKPNIEAEINKELDERRRRLQRSFLDGAESAYKVVKEILDDETASHRDKLTAAKDLMDRGCFKAPERQEMKISGEIAHTDARNLDERVNKYADVYATIEAEEAKLLNGDNESNDT
jgi:phage terminase small subunit